MCFVLSLSARFARAMNSAVVKKNGHSPLWAAFLTSRSQTPLEPQLWHLDLPHFTFDIFFSFLLIITGVIARADDHYDRRLFLFFIYIKNSSWMCDTAFFQLLFLVRYLLYMYYTADITFCKVYFPGFPPGFLFVC